MKTFLKKLANKFGYDLLHLPTNHMHRRQKDLLNAHKIDVLFDVGANTGQYSRFIRSLGYKGRIVSFEPIPEAFNKLREKMEKDSEWKAINTAIGNFNGEIALNISANSYSSSVLEILPTHIKSAPESVYVDKINVPICTIDSIIDENRSPENNLFVKVDTQGFEHQVFEGCFNSLDKISGFQMELSIVPLYKGETLMQEMIELLRSKGYTLKLIEGGHMNYETGELLQVECIFYR
jgi:FkbM family methyltransferase